MMDDIRQCFRRIHRWAQCYVQRHTRETGLTPAQIEALRHIVYHKTMSQQELVEDMGIDKAAVTRIVAALEQEGLSQVRLCVETMGKINVLGDAGEVIRICQADERLLPCIDFGHLNARTQGGLSTREQLSALLDALRNGLGAERAVHFHAHFSHIEYGRGGEIRHLTFADDQYGPDFAPLAALLAERGLAPRIICESAGTQSEDACTMKALFLQAAQHSVSVLL